MLIYTGNHIDDLVELPMDENVVKRVEEIAKIGIHPTSNQYPMFEWALGIPIMDNTTENEYEQSNEEIFESKLIEEIIEDIIEEEAIDENTPEGFLISD